ncbi:MAG: MerR family transcriptional regulator [Corynebacterium humireducens]|jgi:DNA-binding transcriptional MerR regulator|uniref:MerR family transcriptional regulator n=1 Tax=Corynebacterium humireducens TaxID=1223514 RepID=A0A7X6SUN5_9CORY|nr:MerR family transcriptional regulator [Corynebacterium humireducens]
MRISELSSASGVSFPTIKFYLREGLLPAGRRAGQNQAFYTKGHLARLRLIGAMRGIARLSLAEIKGVLSELDGPGTVLDTMAAMQNTLIGQASDEEAHTAEARAILDRIISERGWNIRPESPAYGTAVQSIAKLYTTDLQWSPGMIAEYAEYAEHAAAIGRLDVSTLNFAGSQENLLVQIIEGTLLRRQLVDSLVLLGQQHSAHERLEGKQKGSARSRTPLP